MVEQHIYLCAINRIVILARCSLIALFILPIDLYLIGGCYQPLQEKFNRKKSFFLLNFSKHLVCRFCEALN